MKLLKLAYRAVGIIDRKFLFPLMARYRENKLKYNDFSIISNNCWGGVCYKYFGLQKKTPTVGAYFFADDFVRLCKNLKYYLSLTLTIIPTCESKHIDALKTKGEETALIGKLGDIEIIFLHYQDVDELLKKWERRVKRINWDRLILKFSYQNECNDDLVKDFLSIDNYEKFCFVGERITGHKDEIIFPRSNGKETLDETDNFSFTISAIKILNERLYAGSLSGDRT